MAALAIIRRLLARLMPIRLLNRTIHRAEGEGRRTDRTWHPSRRQKCAQDHRNECEMNGGAAEALHGAIVRLRPYRVKHPQCRSISADIRVKASVQRREKQTMRLSVSDKLLFRLVKSGHN
jgi:hypothetical protein